MGHPVAAATALAVLKEIDDNNLLNNVVQMGDLLEQRLKKRFEQNSYVGDIRGRGLLYGLELVVDKQSKSAFDPSLGLNKKIKKNAMDLGLMCYPFGGTIDGKTGDHVLLAPPYIIAPKEIDMLVERLGEAVDISLAQIGFS